MLMVCGEESECICGFLIGVDDYVVKFFFMLELMVCVKVMFCCVKLEVVFLQLKCGDIEFDCDSYCVYWCLCEVCFGLIEFCLLEFFMLLFGCVFLCLQFLDGVWGYDIYVDECIVDVYIGCLCKVLNFFNMLDVICIVCGVGYLMEG